MVRRHSSHRRPCDPAPSRPQTAAAAADGGGGGAAVSEHLSFQAPRRLLSPTAASQLLLLLLLFAAVRSPTPSKVPAPVGSPISLLFSLQPFRKVGERGRRERSASWWRRWGTRHTHLFSLCWWRARVVLPILLGFHCTSLAHAHTHTRALQEWEWSPPDGVTTVRAERRVVTRDYKHLHCTCVSHLTPSRTHAQLQLQHFNFRSPTFTRGGQVQLTHINKQKETTTVHSNQNLVTVSTVDIFVYISPSALSLHSKCAMTHDE